MITADERSYRIDIPASFIIQLERLADQRGTDVGSILAGPSGIGVHLPASP
jgi:hypothetical protein